MCWCRFWRQVPEGFGGFRCVLAWVPEGCGGFRRVPARAGVGSGDMFRRTSSGSFRRVPVPADV